MDKKVKKITLFRGSDANPLASFRVDGYVYGTTEKSDAKVYGKNVTQITISPKNIGQHEDKASALKEIYPQITQEMIDKAPGFEKEDRFFNALAAYTGDKFDMVNTFKLADEKLLSYFKQKGYDAVRFYATGAKGDEYMIIDPNILNSSSIQAKR